VRRLNHGPFLIPLAFSSSIRLLNLYKNDSGTRNKILIFFPCPRGGLVELAIVPASRSSLVTVIMTRISGAPQALTIFGRGRRDG
jgi:hypothetical protein